MYSSVNGMWVSDSSLRTLRQALRKRKRSLLTDYYNDINSFCLYSEVYSMMKHKEIVKINKGNCN